MNRRGFLGLFAGAALDPERLLWVPGQKLISIPRQRIIIDPLLAAYGLPEGYGYAAQLQRGLNQLNASYIQSHRNGFVLALEFNSPSAVGSSRNLSGFQP